MGIDIFPAVDFLREEARFGDLFAAVFERLVDVFLPLVLLRGVAFLPALLRAGPRVLRDPELELRELEPERREEAFVAGDLRPLERLPVFFALFEPPRDDFLAAAMIRAPI